MNPSRNVPSLFFILLCLLSLPALAATESIKLTASDGAIDYYFGASLSIDGDRVIVSAQGDDDNGIESGSAFVYERDGNGNWVETKLTASDGATADNFGARVSIDGDRVIVGVPLADDNGQNSGSAYVYERDGNGNWVETKLTASDSAAGDWFGGAVSIDGDRVIVSASNDDDNGQSSGSAYVYERDGNGNWVETKLTASDSAAGDRFGGAVSIDGDRVIVGAQFSGNFSGSAYAYERDGNGNWVETKLTASDGAAGDRFGWSVSIDGDRVIVGAPLDDDNGAQSGSAYIVELNLPQITDPSGGSTLSNSTGTETVEWEPLFANVTEWWLYIGSQPGSLDYFNSGNLPASTLSATVSGLPDDASTIYAKLWYRVQGDSTWYFIEEIYTAYGTTPTITSPASGAILAGATDTFIWQDNGATASDYWLTVGSSLGVSDYYSSGNLGSVTSVNATGMPADGLSTVYVRLWYRIGGAGPWLSVDETYVAGTSGAVAPAITSPAPPGPFTDPNGSEMLAWIENGSGAAEFWMYAGSAPGALNYANSGNLGNVLTTTVTGLPTNGTSIWIRLWYRSGGSSPWSYIDEEYTAAGSGPTIDSLSGTGVLTSPDDTFSWMDPSGTVTAWWFYAGSTVGGAEYENSGNLNGATSYTTVNGNLPSGNVPVYVRLWYQAGAGTQWQFVDAVFTSAR